MVNICLFLVLRCASADVSPRTYRNPPCSEGERSPNAPLRGTAGRTTRSLSPFPPLLIVVIVLTDSGDWQGRQICCRIPKLTDISCSVRFSVWNNEQSVEPKFFFGNMERRVLEDYVLSIDAE